MWSICRVHGRCAETRETAAHHTISREELSVREHMTGILAPPAIGQVCRIRRPVRSVARSTGTGRDLLRIGAAKKPDRITQAKPRTDYVRAVVSPS